MEKLKNRFRYFKEKRMTVLVLLFLLLLNVLLILGGCLVLKLLPENHGLSMADALWESLKLILDPGGFLGSKLSAITTIITSLIVLAGMITFTGGIIGYVTNLITTRIDDSKNGVGMLALTGHTLILNWNDRAMSIILDRLADKKADNRDNYIVVLSTEDKQQVEKYIAAKIKAYRYSHVSYNKHDPRVIVREGNPQFPTELERVNCDEASHIFVVQPESSTDADYDVLKTYFSLAERITFLKKESESLPSDKQRDVEEFTTVVVETSDQQIGCAVTAVPLGSYMGREYLTSALSNDFTLGKIYAQMVLMPELVDTCNEILSMSGSTLAAYEVWADTPSFEKQLQTMKYAIPLYGAGDDKGNQERVYLVADSTSEDTDFADVSADESNLSHKDITIVPDTSFDTHTIVIHGINNKLPYILNAILSNNASDQKRACTVKMVVSQEQRKSAEAYYSKPEYRAILQGSPIIVSRNFDVEPMLSVLDHDLRSLLILAADCDTPEERDKNVFEAWMGLANAISDDENLEMLLDGKVILELSNQDNAGLLASSQHKLLVVSNQLLSLFMIQMSEGRNLQNILLDMLCTDDDPDFEALGIEANNFCDLLSIPVSKFFGCSETVRFLSKHDCVDVVFRGTKRKFIPIGCVKDGSTYLFPNGKYSDTRALFGGQKISIDMSDSILACGDDDGIYVGNLDAPSATLDLAPDDYIIVIRRAI